MKRTIFLVLSVFFVSLKAGAWVYPEHRDITNLAIQKLDSVHRAEFDRIWALAILGNESRLDRYVADLAQELDPKTLDYGAWTAIGGDHSTSANNMTEVILRSDWIINVAAIAARLKNDIATAKNNSELLNSLRESDLRLLKADPEYVTRAGANNGHFMLARPDVNTSAADYFRTCYTAGGEVNPIGTYMWFHASAILKAQRLRNEILNPGERSALSLSAMADEAFALHFLEDCFASGHVAGIWGNASQRKGTHDYYNEKGLDETNWKGERFVLMGDAYMRPQDAELAAKTVCMSLNQFTDALLGKPAAILYNDEPGQFTPDTLNVAKLVHNIYRKLDTTFYPLFDSILITTPVPGLVNGPGELPRFRAEIGPFIGIAPSARFSFLSGGFGTTQNTAGFVPGLELGIRIGLGLEGVLNESGDGLAFIDLGWRQDGASSMKIENDPDLKQFGAIFSAIPSRDAFYFRLRLPFCVIPGDLLFAGPFVYLANKKAFNKMVTAAANGGLLPWQYGLMTPIGRFQFILGREIGVCFYGIGRGADSYLLPDIKGDPENVVLITMYSTQLDFPILEYRPFRTYSAGQSAHLVLQINAGLDIPGKRKMIYPVDAQLPDVELIWHVGLRLAFDWRYYFKTKSKS